MTWEYCKFTEDDVNMSDEDKERVAWYHNEYPILKFFEYSHLPKHLQEINKPFRIQAINMALGLLLSDEVRMGLRKLLEAKDCFVRAALKEKK